MRLYILIKMREKDLRNLKIKSFSLTKKILGLIQVFIKYLIKIFLKRLFYGWTNDYNGVNI